MTSLPRPHPHVQLRGGSLGLWEGGVYLRQPSGLFTQGGKGTGTQPSFQSTTLLPPQDGVDQSGPVILLLSFFLLLGKAELLLT